MSINPLRSYRATQVSPGTPLGQFEAKACATCAHHLKGACMHPASPRDLATGAPTRCCWMRQGKNQPDGICGLSGRLFEAPLSAHVGQPSVNGIGQTVDAGSEGGGPEITGTGGQHCSDHLGVGTSVALAEHLVD